MSVAHVLDRPAWNALTTRQAQFATGGTRALRYRPEINLFAAATDRTEESLAALSALSSRGEAVGLVEREPFPALAGMKVAKDAAVSQMVATGSPGLPDAFDWQPLGDADAPEMLALATLTEPGPFFSDTHRMGRFIGVREGGRLIAMAGERMRVPGFTEVSGVCTHPDHRGRGLAGKLMRVVVDRIVGEGDAAFLHVYPDNAGAIGLYEALGFEFRAELRFVVMNKL